MFVKLKNNFFEEIDELFNNTLEMYTEPTQDEMGDIYSDCYNEVREHWIEYYVEKCE